MEQRQIPKKRPARTSVTVVSLHGGDVRVLEAALRNGRMVVERWGSAPAGQGGAAAEGDDARGRSVLAALSEAGIKGKSVLLCLPAQAVVLKRVQLPPASSEQIPQLVQFEAQRHLPLPVDQLSTGYRMMGESSPTGTEVLLAITRRDELVRLTASLERAGLHVEGCGIDALALASECLQATGHDAAGENGHARLLVSSDSQGVHAQVLHHDRLLFNRFLPFAGSEWSTDLRRSLTSYALDQPAHPIGEVVILGDADEPALAQITQLPVRHLVRPAVTTDGAAIPADFTPLAGVARQWLGAGDLGLMLDPEAWRTEVRSSGRSQAVAAVVAAIALMAVFVTLQLDRQQKARADGETARRLSRQLENDKKQLGRLRKTRDELQERLRQAGGDPDTLAAAGSSNRSATPLELLRQVSARIPSDVWLTQVVYRQGQPLQLLGTTRQGAAVTTFIRSLESLPDCRQVELGYLRSANVEETAVTQFRVDCSFGDRPHASTRLTGDRTR